MDGVLGDLLVEATYEVVHSSFRRWLLVAGVAAVVTIVGIGFISNAPRNRA